MKKEFYEKGIDRYDLSGVDEALYGTETAARGESTSLLSVSLVLYQFRVSMQSIEAACDIEPSAVSVCNLGRQHSHDSIENA